MTVRVVLLLSLVTCTPAFAQLPAARLTAAFPPGGKAGTSVDVTLAGQDLDAATELRFPHPGITGRKTGRGSAAEATFAVAIAADVPVGTYDCRVVGRFGISNPRAFVVGDREEVNGAKPGTSLSSPGKLPLNAVVSARCAANAYDHWAFDARAGQRLTIACAAREID